MTAQRNKGACKHKARNQESLNLQFVPPHSLQEQTYLQEDLFCRRTYLQEQTVSTHRIKSRYLGLCSFPSATSPALGSSLGSPLHCFEPVPPLTNEKGRLSGKHTRSPKQVFQLFSTATKEGGSSTTKKPFQVFFSSPQKSSNSILN